MRGPALFPGSCMKRNRRSIVLLLATVLACLAGGCKHNMTPTQKQEAMKEWNQARARVMASLAKSQFESGHVDEQQRLARGALRRLGVLPQALHRRLLSLSAVCRFRHQPARDTEDQRREISAVVVRHF